MSWLFGKKQVPELPPIPEFDQQGALEYKKREHLIQETLPPLPSFPSSSDSNLLSNQAVKEAIGQKEFYKEELYQPPQSLPPMTREMSIPSMHSQIIPPKEESPKQVFSQVKPQEKSNEPIFIRIDKYQASLENLREAKKKIIEVETLLKDIKEIKAKEEAELQRWENEIRDAKENLDSIDSAIFQKV